MLLCDIILYYTIQYNTILYYTILYYTILYYDTIRSVGERMAYMEKLLGDSADKHAFELQAYYIIQLCWDESA